MLSAYRADWRSIESVAPRQVEKTLGETENVGFAAECQVTIFQFDGRDNDPNRMVSSRS